MTSSANTESGGTFPGSRRRPRLVRTAVTAAIRDARAADRIAPADEPIALMAVAVAGQLDAAAKSDRAGEVVRLTKSLRELLDVLPLRPDTKPKPHDGDDEPAPAGRDPFDAELEALVGAGPTVGDAAHT